MTWLLMRMKKPHILCGLSRYADFLSASTANNYCLESLTTFMIMMLHSTLNSLWHVTVFYDLLRLAMTFYDVLESVLTDITLTLFFYTIQLLLLCFLCRFYSILP